MGQRFYGRINWLEKDFLLMAVLAFLKLCFHDFISFMQVFASICAMFRVPFKFWSLAEIYCVAKVSVAQKRNRDELDGRRIVELLIVCFIVGLL